MNIIAAEIRWLDEYGNAPSLEVTTDGPIPRREDLRYEEVFPTAESGGVSREQEAITGTRQRDLHILYAEHPSGYVSFIHIGNETSYPGASGGDFTMRDGTTMHVRSGWTISSTAIRDHADVIECAYRDKPQYRSCMGGFILADKAREVIAEFLPAVEMFDDGSGWTFKWRDGPTKAEWQESEHAKYVRDESYQRRPYSQWPEFAEQARMVAELGGDVLPPGLGTHYSIEDLLP